MHRTEGDAFVIEGGKRRFKDQDLPTYPGTVDTAEYNNAVQEEICNIIETLGGTVEPDAATDRANGWHQLYTLLLQSAKIDDAALKDFNLAKGYGNIATVLGLYSLLAVPGEITLHYEAVGADDITIFLSTLPSNRCVGISDETSGCSLKLIKGIECEGGPGEDAFDSTQYRKAGFAMHAYGYTVVNAGITRFTTDFTTNIPTSCSVINASIHYPTSGTSVVAPVKLELTSSGGFWKVTYVWLLKRATDPDPTSDNFDCIIEYDASSL